MSDQSGAAINFARLNSKKAFLSVLVCFTFMSEKEWNDFVDKHINDSYGKYSLEYIEYLRNDARAFEDEGHIWIKESARNEPDFKLLILHELGHAVLDLDHVETEGHIMNSNRNNRSPKER